MASTVSNQVSQACHDGKERKKEQNLRIIQQVNAGLLAQTRKATHTLKKREINPRS